MWCLIFNVFIWAKNVDSYFKLKLIYPKERRIERGPSKIEHGHFENGTCFLEPRLTLWQFQFHDSMIVFMSRWPGCQGLNRLTLKIWLCPTIGYPHTQQMVSCGGSQWVGYIIYPCFLQVWTYRISTLTHKLPKWSIEVKQAILDCEERLQHTAHMKQPNQPNQTDHPCPNMIPTPPNRCYHVI